jgi:hypothetical protein
MEVDVRLATEKTRDDRTLWRSEVYFDGRLEDASGWSEHVVDAIRDGRDLKRSALSDWAFREARYEAHQLYARAS